MSICSCWISKYEFVSQNIHFLTLYAILLGGIHGFLNFFDINFDRLHFSKYTDQCVRINFPEDFWKRSSSFFFIAFQTFSSICRRYRYSTKRPSQLSATFQDTGICIILHMIGSKLHIGYLMYENIRNKYHILSG